MTGIPGPGKPTLYFIGTVLMTDIPGPGKPTLYCNGTMLMTGIPVSPIYDVYTV